MSILNPAKERFPLPAVSITCGSRESMVKFKKIYAENPRHTCL